MKIRKLKIHGRSRKIALEPEFWSALDELAFRLSTTQTGLVERVGEIQPGVSLASALRVFITQQFAEWTKAYERGSAPAGGSS